MLGDPENKACLSINGELETNNQVSQKSHNSTSSKKKLFRQTSKRAKLTGEQKWRSLAIVFIIVDVLLLLITLTFVIGWVKGRENRHLTPQSSTFCLPKEEVSLHKDDDEENFKHFENKTENGKQVLCTDTGKHLDSLVYLYVERKYRIERANDSIRKPVAQVVGIEYSFPADDHSNTHEVLWHAEAQHSFVNNVNYKHGRFVIIQKGYYYIYSQVTFKESNVTDTPYTSLCHFIFKIKPNGIGKYTEQLLKSSQSKCQLQAQTSNSTSYIGAVFYLEKNDEVQVKVTHPDKITKSHYSNYFGLYMI